MQTHRSPLPLLLAAACACLASTRASAQSPYTYSVSAYAFPVGGGFHYGVSVSFATNPPSERGLRSVKVWPFAGPAGTGTQPSPYVGGYVGDARVITNVQNSTSVSNMAGWPPVTSYWSNDRVYILSPDTSTSSPDYSGGKTGIWFTGSIVDTDPFAENYSFGFDVSGSGLPTLEWELIVGRDGDMDYPVAHGFAATGLPATPEPATMALLAAGACLVRRQRHRTARRAG